MKLTIVKIISKFPFFIQRFIVFLLGARLKVQNDTYHFQSRDLSIHYFVQSRVTRYLRGLRGLKKNLVEAYLLNYITLNNDDLVIDIGANIGEFGIVAFNINPQIQLISFEPSANEFKCLTMNSKNHNNTLHNIGLWSEKTRLSFYLKEESADNSIFEMHEYKEKIEIEVDRLDNVIPFGRVKLLKIEAEGAEPEILKGGSSIVNRCEYIVVDGGPERGLNQESTIESVINFLVQKEFDVVKINLKRGTVLFRNKALI